MARRSLVAAGTLAALAASALTVGAAAQTGSAPRPARVPTLAAIQQAQARAFVAAGVPQRAVSAAWLAAGRADPSPTGSASTDAATTAVGTGTLLMPAGDMNGDGVDEVLDTRYHAEGSSGERLVLYCRNGATGAVLWRKVMGPQPNHVYLPSPELIGPKALPGVVIADIGTTQAGQSTTVSLRFLALDDMGVKFWSRTLSGTTNSSTGAEQHLPFPVGLDTFQNKAPDWLIAVLDSPGGDNAPVTMAPVRVRGTDGVVAPVGDKVTSSDSTPGLTDVPDLSGDGLADVVLVVPGASDSHDDVLARHGTDGSQIWANTALTLNPGASATPVGDVHASATGSPAVGDVAINSGPATGGGLGLPLPIPDPTAPSSSHGKVSLLDGASGTDVWDNTGDYAYPVVQAGSPLKPATGVVTNDVTSDSTTTTTTTTLATYGDDGKQIYSVSWKATTKTDSSGQNSGLGLVLPVGDFDADGSIDGLALVDVTSGNNIGSFSTLFHGVDGSPVKSGAASPLGGSTTGHGDDLVLVRTHRGLIVSVHKGADNTVLFQTKVAHTRGVHLGTALGAPIHENSSCADVLVAGDGAYHAAVGVLTAKGALEWVVRFDPRTKAPGTVYHPTTRPRIPIC